MQPTKIHPTCFPVLRDSSYYLHFVPTINRFMIRNDGRFWIIDYCIGKGPISRRIKASTAKGARESFIRRTGIKPKIWGPKPKPILVSHQFSGIKCEPYEVSLFP